MKKEGYYSSGEFARLAHITKKTIRYYDEQELLKPSLVTESGARFYTDEDLARLQQIILLKYLGFSLSDIKEMTIHDADYHFMSNSLKMQLKIVEDKIEKLQTVAETIRHTTSQIEKECEPDWKSMLDLIHMTGMETSLKNQYSNASNISARISLHQQFSTNKQGWFPWLFEHLELKAGEAVLEVGCGDGTLWTKNIQRLPEGLQVTLTDLSDGMLRDARRSIEEQGDHGQAFHYEVCDCAVLPFEDCSMDVVIANHVLFYCQDVKKSLRELYRVLKPGGRMICATYGEKHMKEISQLVAEFDNRIVLSGENLFQRFGKENGEQLWRECMEACLGGEGTIQWNQYEDSLVVTDADPLIFYVLSCHGNQNQFITDRYQDFRGFVKEHLRRRFAVTKDAGFFRIKK